MKVSRKRVFILGPSHHVYLTRCEVSDCDYYDTPLGRLRIDKASECFFVLLKTAGNLSVNNELLKTGKFQSMKVDTDEDEHSIEMHLPYVYYTFHGYAYSHTPFRSFFYYLVQL